MRRLLRPVLHAALRCAAVAPLLGFYVFFATVLYPLSGSLHPHGLLASLAGAVPAGLHGLVKVG